MPTFLKFENVSKRFGGVTALAGIDWDVAAGEVHCLVGENGCGKSTAIKIVAGVHPADPGGRIEIDGAPRDRLDPALAKSLGIQVIYQDLSLFPNLSVAENIAVDETLGALAKPVSRARMRRIAADVLGRLGFALPLDAPLSDLPIASRQIVAIARGLAARARLLFMDEPTASLTRSEVKTLLGLVDRLRRDGIAVVFVSHRLEEVIEIADRVTVLRDGRKVGTWAARDLDVRRIGELMTGLQIEHTVTARDRAAEPAVLEVAGLTRRGEYADVSFSIRRGEIVGLTGLLGAGRTELALTLFGMTRPDSGSIRVDGRDVRFATNQDAIRAGIAYVPEDRLKLGLDLRQSVQANMVVSVLGRLAGRFGILAPARLRSTAEGWVERLRIKIPALDKPVSTLSGGNQQRVVIAKWLATEPKLLILDSPTVGVDIGNKQAIHRIVRGLAEAGVAILMICDEIPEAYFNADRVLHMRDGRLVGDFRPGRDPERLVEEAVYA
ncbi:sugar ABC transporter ATP-binding protein [Prosthecomicrobium sp. N25]|uniref:sugar ABC transporter ATP-binding protein n=1 Tax=Prosthecomicrobium sp. N25 TaxID=3129254 RepID=UPI003077F04D